MVSSIELFSRPYGKEEDPAVVFVHGGPGANSWAFEKSTAKRLTRNNYFVIVYDQRGCGRNEVKLRLADPVPSPEQDPMGRQAVHRLAKYFGKNLTSDDHTLRLEAATPASVSPPQEDATPHKREDDKREDPEAFKIQNAAVDLHEVIERYHQRHPLRSPILVGHSWGGFLSLNYLDLCIQNTIKTKVEGLVMVCTPIDYPDSFHTILTQVHKKYDLARRLLFMENFPVMREIENLKKEMFNGQKPPASNDVRVQKHLYFKGDDVKEVFRHARMLEFTSPEMLLMNSEYRELLDRLSSLQDSQLLTRFEEKISAQFFVNEFGEDRPENQLENRAHISMFEKNNIDLLQRVSTEYPVHAIYGDDDKMFSKRHLRSIRETLSSFSANRFSYIYGAGHHPFLEQNRQFVETLSKHLARIRKDLD